MAPSRSISPTLALLLEELELERRKTVPLVKIAELAKLHGIRTPARILAHRLAQKGWLLETQVAGVWEFAPADRAGPISDADPFLTLRAFLARDDLPIALALGSALWLHNLADRFPYPHEVAIPSGSRVPRALRDEYRLVRHQAHLANQEVNGLPVHRTATVLVHLAHRPTDVTSWAAVLDLLPDLLATCADDDIEAELADRPHATHVRLAYLLQSLAPDLIRDLNITPAGKVWFGPRRPLRRHDARWNVADTLLPFSPRELGNRP
jgi:predicted transcriptional regulator of viral defense system